MTCAEGADMSGLDLAFYRGRSKYHTKFDAIPHTVGEKAALWAMMEAAKGSGTALLEDTGAMHSKSSSQSVYFDRKHPCPSVQTRLCLLFSQCSELR